MDIENIVRENIKNLFHLSLATSVNDRPWVCEVHFAYDSELNLYFRSKPSRRHSLEIAINPNVSGNIVREHALDEQVVGVYFEGTAEMLMDVNEQDPAYIALSKRLGKDKSAIEEALNEKDGHKFYKIIVRNWYVFGRFGADHGQKLKLEWN
jgi:uncharacterized protein YhbP (UPF0306 family)